MTQAFIDDKLGGYFFGRLYEASETGRNFYCRTFDLLSTGREIHMFRVDKLTHFLSQALFMKLPQPRRSYWKSIRIIFPLPMMAVTVGRVY